MKVELRKIELLKPHELVDENWVGELAKEIVSSGIWSHPIIVDKKSNIVMDGHHRLEAAKKVQLNKIPCLLFDYDSDNTTVTDMKSGIPFDLSIIRRAADSNSKLPIKTTRHTFQSKINTVEISLDDLR